VTPHSGRSKQEAQSTVSMTSNSTLKSILAEVKEREVY